MTGGSRNFHPVERTGKWWNRDTNKNR